MGFLKNLNIKNTYTTYSLQDSGFLSALGITEDASIENLSETVYFACIKTLGESVSKIPIRIMQSTDSGEIEDTKHYLNYILKRDINPYMSNVNFLSTVELLRQHYGNAFCYIERDRTAKVKHLWILPNDSVTVVCDDKGLFKSDDRLFYQYVDKQNHETYTFGYKDVIHLRTSTSFDGIIGIPVRDILKTQLDTRLAGQKFLNKNYSNDMFGGKLLVQYSGSLDDKAKEILVAGLESFRNKTASGAYVPVPLGLELKPLQMNLTDNDFTAINQSSALEIAAAFGIRPYQLNRDSNYANIELQQLDFYLNTLMSLFAVYEQEFTKKLFSYNDLTKGYYIDWNQDEILRGDLKTRVESIALAVDKGILSTNEARQMLKKPRLEGMGDIPMVNGSYTPLTMAEQGINYNQNAGGDNKNA